MLLSEGCMLNGHTQFNFFEHGSITLNHWCNEVIILEVYLFQGVIDSEFIFMDDNVRLYCVCSIDGLLKTETTTCPLNSCVVNPIEHE